MSTNLTIALPDEVYNSLETSARKEFRTAKQEALKLICEKHAPNEFMYSPKEKETETDQPAIPAGSVSNPTPNEGTTTPKKAGTK